MATLTPSASRIYERGKITFTLVTDSDSTEFDADADVDVTSSPVNSPNLVVGSERVLSDTQDGKKRFGFDITFPLLSNSDAEVTYTVTVSDDVVGVDADVSASVVLYHAFSLESPKALLFFTDAHPTIDSDRDALAADADEDVKNDRENLLKVFDKQLRTSVDAMSAFSVTWDTSISYDAVVLVLQKATAWIVTPFDAIPAAASTKRKNGTLIPEELQYVYIPLEMAASKQIDVTATGTGAKLREVYFLKKYLDMSANQDRPFRYYEQNMDPGRRAYRSEDDSLVFYSGLTPGGKSVHHIGWDFLPRARVNALQKLFLGPPVREPFFIYADPVERPNVVHRVYWNNDFMPRPSGSSLKSGYTLDMELHEV
ncbi:MAG: hypothetical protein OXI43_20110 [Candidatus Poribacteria bacterium]|nr:hypothetical protein [Candidatus Poribacteria bacterium]